MAKREAEELKRQQEQAALTKAEELAAKKAEEARVMAEQNAARWAEEEAARAKESSDYHLTTNKHAQAAEDELDRKEETSRRTAAAAKGPKRPVVVKTIAMRAIRVLARASVARLPLRTP